MDFNLTNSKGCQLDMGSLRFIKFDRTIEQKNKSEKQFLFQEEIGSIQNNKIQFQWQLNHLLFALSIIRNESWNETLRNRNIYKKYNSFKVEIETFKIFSKPLP